MPYKSHIKFLVMDVLSSFPHKSKNACLEEEEKEEEEEYIRVLGIPYLQMLQMGQWDGNEEPVIML